ncbi:hypothetical protein EAI99_03135 [Alistipes onderdonkii]|nr:hypothetical protein EAI99_03135 [Alistipes onderdonkii]
MERIGIQTRMVIGCGEPFRINRTQMIMVLLGQMPVRLIYIIGKMEVLFIIHNRLTMMEI